MSETNNKSEYTKPPDFLKDASEFRQYEQDIKRWTRCTTVDKKKQGDVILLNIPPGNKLKEAVEFEVGDKVVDNPDGVKLILEVLEGLHGSDEVLECYLKFRELEQKHRTVGQDILEYVNEWEVTYARAKDKGVTLDERCKAFKLLMTTNLEEVDLKLVLSEVDMKSEAGKKSLFNQVKSGIRKYYGAGTLSLQKRTDKTLISESELSKMEDVFLAKGWVKPQGKRKGDVKDKDGDSKKSNRENGYSREGVWRKCYKCIKDCSHGAKKCNCVRLKSNP